MADKLLAYAARISGGATIDRRLVVPRLAADPDAPVDGALWLNTTTGFLNYRTAGVTVPLSAQDLDEEAVRDVVGAMVVGGNLLTATYDDTADTLTLDLDSLSSANITDFISAVRGAISGGSTATSSTTTTGGVVAVDVTDSPLLGGNAPAFYRNADNHTDGTTNHVFTAADDSKLAGIEAGATANAADAFLLERANHTGTQTAASISDFLSAARAAISATDTATLDVTYTGGVLSADVLDSPTVGGRTPTYLLSADNHVDGTTNHVFTAADDSKLAGIADGATANATDAALRDRATHTGTQTAATISDFATAVAALNIDAETLNGMTAAEIQTAVTSAIVDAAPGTLDTLNELAAALGDDPNFATSVTTALATRARTQAFDVPTTALDGDGVAAATITHNFGTRDVQVTVRTTGGTYEDVEVRVLRPTLNTVQIVSEGEAIPATWRAQVTAVAAADAA